MCLKQIIFKKTRENICNLLGTLYLCTSYPPLVPATANGATKMKQITNTTEQLAQRIKHFTAEAIKAIEHNEEAMARDILTRRIPRLISKIGEKGMATPQPQPRSDSTEQVAESEPKNQGKRR